MDKLKENDLKMTQLRENVKRKWKQCTTKMIGGWEEWKLSFPVQNLATLANLILLQRRRQQPYGDAWHISFFSVQKFQHRARSTLAVNKVRFILHL